MHVLLFFFMDLPESNDIMLNLLSSMAKTAVIKVAK